MVVDQPITDPTSGSSFYVWRMTLTLTLTLAISLWLKLMQNIILLTFYILHSLHLNTHNMAFQYIDVQITLQCTVPQTQLQKQKIRLYWNMKCLMAAVHSNSQKQKQPRLAVDRDQFYWIWWQLDQAFNNVNGILSLIRLNSGQD